MKLQDSFNKFVEDIELGNKQIERIDSAIRSLSDYLMKSYNLPNEDIFVQGSYANDTAVKPAPSLEGGEYDVDIIAMIGDQAKTASQTLSDLENTIKMHSYYGSIIDNSSKTAPCIRLRYADDEVGGFHVDLVPARVCYHGAPIEIPMRDDTWRETAPCEYTDWCRNLGPDFARLVKIFKRWRDENQGVRVAIKSILLQVLIANNISIDSESDAVSYTKTLENIETYLAQYETSIPIIPNPVLSSENLADRWEMKEYLDFKECLTEAVGLALEALSETDLTKSSELWNQLLGESFPVGLKEPDLNKAVQGLGRVRFEEFPEDKWTTIEFKYDAEITGLSEAEVEKHIRTARQPYYRTLIIKVRQKFDSGTMLTKGLDLFYTAKTNTPKPYNVFWKVVNTGVDAESHGEKATRGNIFSSTSPHKESTDYTGTHWIECFIEKNGACVAKSGRFYIEIE